MAPTCAVRLLGGFRVEVDGRPVAPDAWRHRRGADLVKLLALAPQHRLHRDQVMARLWPQLGAESAAANLRKAVHYARQALGGKESIDTHGELVALWPAGQLEVDADRADAGSADLLPEDPYTDWIQPHRERLRSRTLQHLRASGRWEEVLDIDQTDEEACRVLMRAELDQGNRQAAIRQFQRLRDVLRVDLGTAPEPATLALFEEALQMQGSRASVALERAQAFLARGLVKWNERDLDAAQQLAQQAMSLSGEHHLGRELGEASTLLGMVAFARGRWPKVFREHFTAALEAPDQAAVLLDAHLCLAEASLAVNHGSVASLARELLDVSIDKGSTPGEALISLLIGESEFFSGRLDESGEWLSRAIDMYRQLDGGSGLAFALLRLGEIAVAHDSAQEAERQVAAARVLAEKSELAPHLRARVLEALIKIADGPDRYQRLIGEAEALVAQPKHLCGPCSIGLRVWVAIVCARAGDVTRSRRWLEDAERMAGMWSADPWQAAVWEARAALRLAEGDRGQGLALLREASSLFARCGRPLDEARCRSAIQAVG
jgi:DNA-binding SARP family transcriptional activator